MSAHTPGPWSVCGANDSKCSCGLIWAKAADISIATVTGDDPEQGVTISPDMQQANARLIAAAPDLLALAKRVGCQDAGYCGSPHPVLRPDGLCFVCRVIAMVEAKRS